MSKKSCTIYLVRHGESEGNVKAKLKESFTSTTNYGSGLSENGKRQVLKLANKLKSISFDVIFSSDLTRAQETAEILRQQKDVPIHLSKSLRERNYGKWNEKFYLIKEKLENEIKKLPENDKMKFTYNGIETEIHAADRLSQFCDKVISNYKEKNILIVSHGNIIRMFLVKIGYATYSELPIGSLQNAGYIIFESNGKNFNIKETYGVKKTKSLI